MTIPKRILAVDDEERVLFVLRESLKGLGDAYEIITAHSGREALTKAEEQAIDLLITDLRMPDVDGVALTQALRTSQPELRVIWITAYNSYAAEAQRLDIRQYLRKPLDVEEVREAALTALRPRILVVEDQPDEQRLYTRALQKVGYNVIAVSTEPEAREMLHSKHFDLVCCDIHLGKAQAFDLLLEYWDRLREQHTTVVIISGDPRYRDPSEELGVEFYIEKPISISSLVILTERLLSRNRPIARIGAG
ncbi:MAG: response regulator [Anaerolineae bacterium]|nr:response regulator [Anaerolineae bacterium]